MNKLFSILVISFLMFCSNRLVAQSEKSLDSLFSSLTLNAEKAISDTTQGEIFLYLPGSIGCPPLSMKDNEIMKKYGFMYTCQGCVRFGSDNVPEYNRIMINYLTKKYNRNIISELRLDILGITK